MNTHDAIIEHCVAQVFQANMKCQESDIYAANIHIYLSTQNLTLPKGRAMKLVPQYIGSYHVVEAHNTASMATLELPDKLKYWCISLSFHTSLT